MIIEWRSIKYSHQGIFPKAQPSSNKARAGILFKEQMHCHIGTHLVREHIFEHAQFKMYISGWVLWLTPVNLVI
jgi:hypothetical protein